MHTIETEALPIELRPGVDPFSVYRLAVKRFGAQHAFLAESAGGPTIDCQRSFIAVNRLGSVYIDAHRIRIDGVSTVRQHLKRTAEAIPGMSLFDAGGCAEFASVDVLWRTLRALLFSSYRMERDAEKFVAGFVVRIGYDAASLIERLQHRLLRDEPTLIRLDLYQHMISFAAGHATLYVNDAPGFDVPDIPALLGLFETSPQFFPLAPDVGDIRWSTTKGQYLDASWTALEHIRAGDIYQVQLGHEIRVRSGMDPLSLYGELRVRNPSPYMFLHQADDMTLIGASPENYVQLVGRRLSMRPIAGTLAKSAAADSRSVTSELCASVKENAEHVMLVDLCRNDIGRLCEPHSLDVPSLMALEEFPSLYHLVSTVSGDLRPECDAVDVLRATFPAGTMVGAPKIRAMEIIEDLEVSPRGQYAGAIGLIDFRGEMNMALCIRMACLVDGEYRLRASAGIVSDSHPEREWQETLAKMRMLYRTVTGEELLK
ncbi:anthranilate synthase component I family protein [Burkholderia multivorans]|uniref:anthranilate synthase component I family protein n=1 Tax=Burkholderia multivorans TaxID=87883 RepID=UPI000D009404|nr:anthranilate synthase component I family protein [Burkholderia multivorans]MCO8628294.1 anthranilate synthase component I family protein [Burkholderia multivorans]PRF39639.1 2-amino-4-deoxychorismate synthase [Burkholderia multivorans]PRG79274.1 2-amino-4-deoxychorismate synthase [Burkholderia multivorans]